MLGQPGTILLASMTLVSAGLNAYQLYRGNQASRWKGTSEAFEKELIVVRARSARLEAENIEYVKTLSELKAKTDLSSLERLNLEADRRNQEVHERIILSLNTLIDNSTTRNAQLSAVLLENTSAIRALSERMTNEFELHRGAFANMIRALKEKTSGDTLSELGHSK